MFEFIGFLFWLGGWVLYLGMWAFGAFVILGVIGMILEKPKSDAERALEREQQQAQQQAMTSWMQHGSLNQVLKCPHCEATGHVRVRTGNHRKGISGGKAAGAYLTGGLSLAVTGISRREKMTKAHCGNCNSTWTF